MDFDEAKFEKIKQEAKDFYSKMGKVRCPYLNCEVHFNEEGFNHLLSKSWNRGRSVKEQCVRLKLLSQTVEVIKLSHTLQEFDECQMFVRQKINSRWEKRLRMVRYYVFIAFLREKGIRLKIVVKEIDGGAPFFWSVYPSWKIKTRYDGDLKKVFYSGNPEED